MMELDGKFHGESESQFLALEVRAVEVARDFFGSEMRYRSKTEAEYQRGGTGYVKESQH